MSDDSKTLDSKEEPLDSRYANAFGIGSNQFEFVFDFGYSPTKNTEPRWYSRTVTAPGHAKVLARMLFAKIDKYESTFGVIKEPQEMDAKENGPDETT